MTKLKITESDIIRAIGDYLQVQRNLGKLMFIRNNTGAIPIEAGKHKRRFVRFGDKGSPDFLVWRAGAKMIPLGVINPERDFTAITILRAIAIEAKSETGRQSKDQLKWQTDFERIGGEYHLIKCLEDLIEVVG